MLIDENWIAVRIEGRAKTLKSIDVVAEERSRLLDRIETELAHLDGAVGNVQLGVARFEMLSTLRK